MTIPLICLSYNQPSYLKMLIAHWQYYHNDIEKYPIIIFDNGSTSPELMQLLRYYSARTEIKVVWYDKNNFIPNLKDFIANYITGKYEYYVLSDCDILPHPSAPWNYLDVFMHLIDSGYHRAGFGLISDNLPDTLHLGANIAHDERQLLSQPVSIDYNGKTYSGFKAPIDTTFCMYTTKNSGWSAPMGGNDWGNCVRIFEAFHMPWYIDGENMTPEMDFYFTSAKYRVPGTPSAGANNSRPKQYIND